MKRGNWTDNPCWYCSVRDAGRTAFVLGPFNNEAACRQWAYYHAEDGGDPQKLGKLVRIISDKYGAFTHFYSWGMVKIETGHREGIMNSTIPEAQRDFFTLTTEA
jgi:hypothetical protein